MNITSNNSPECPDWMQRFCPTDLKWLNDEKTAALCILNDSRYRLKVIWTEDGSTDGTKCSEIASTQDTELEKLETVFDDFESLREVSPDEVTEQIRTKLGA